MADARAAEPRDALEVAVARDEVDRDRVAVAGDRERGRLADLVHELLEVGAGEVAEVEPSEDGVRVPERAHAEPVATRGGDVLDEAGARERAELARDRARADPRPARDVGRPELAAVGERVEDLDGAHRRFDIAGGGLTGSGHRASLFPLIARYCV